MIWLSSAIPGRSTDVLSHLQKARLTAKPTKCQLGRQQCKYLGHLVGNGEVCPEQSNIDAVANFPQPVTKKQIRSFLGLMVITGD